MGPDDRGLCLESPSSLVEFPMSPRSFLRPLLVACAAAVALSSSTLQAQTPEARDVALWSVGIKQLPGTLRRKLSDDDELQLIETVIASGYRMLAVGEVADV